MYKPRKPSDVPYFTTEIVATSSSSSSPAKKPSGSAAKKHVASCKPGFQPSTAAHSMAVSTSFRVIPRIWYCGVVVVISGKSEYGSSSASAVSSAPAKRRPDCTYSWRSYQRRRRIRCLAYRLPLLSATTGRERLQHMLGTNFRKTGADHRAPPCRCYSFPDGYRIVLKRRVLLTQASRLVSLSESCSYNENVPNFAFVIIGSAGAAGRLD